MNSCFCDSKQSIFSDQIKTMVNQMECERCKNLILRQENRRTSMCGDCVQTLYSPKTCNACNGRISFQDLKQFCVQQNVIKKKFNECRDPANLKLCNCFPKYPSQNFSSIQPNEPGEIQILPQIIGKACSFNEMMMMHHIKKPSPPFHSQTCLQMNSKSSDESSSDEN